MKWYKYLPKQHAESMIRDGCIKLGILSGYHDLEVHGGAVGDPDENTRVIYSHDTQVKTDPSELNPLERLAFNFGNAKIDRFEFYNNRIEVNARDEDLLAYCASNSFDVEAMHRISEENLKSGNEAYDACVEIVDHVGFVRALGVFLGQECGFKLKGWGDCFYRDRRVHWTHAHKTSAWNIKGENYSYQKECRVVFSPPGSFKDNSLIAKIPSIKQYCRIYYLVS